MTNKDLKKVKKLDGPAALWGKNLRGEVRAVAGRAVHLEAARRPVCLQWSEWRGSWEWERRQHGAGPWGGLRSHCEDTGFHSEGDGNLLEVSGWRKNMVWVKWWTDHNSVQRWEGREGGEKQGPVRGYMVTEMREMVAACPQRVVVV